MSLASSMAALSQNNLTGKMLNCHKEKDVHFYWIIDFSPVLKNVLLLVCEEKINQHFFCSVWC